MRAATVVEVVTLLYVGAGRTAGETEFATWERLLEDLPDDDAVEVAVVMARTLTDRQAMTTVGVYREAFNAHRKRVRQEQPAIPDDTGPALSPEEQVANVAKMRELVRFGGTKGLRDP